MSSADQSIAGIRAIIGLLDEPWGPSRDQFDRSGLTITEWLDGWDDIAGAPKGCAAAVYRLGYFPLSLYMGVVNGSP